MDLVEIGAGGGSIGWVDSGGALRVGPRERRGRSGPGLLRPGRALPTLTDANLVLGRLNPDFFLGGKMRLCRDAAVRAVDEHLAGPLSLTLTEAAFGMVEIANAQMIEALRLISVQRGFDPREFALVAFGGAGPLHANAIAHELRIPEVIIPLSPGVSSALGLLLADIKHDFVRTYIKILGLVDLDLVNHAFEEFEREGRALLEREGIGAEDQWFLRELDMRLKGQSFELKVALDPGPIGVSQLQRAAEAFHELHELTYGHSFPGEPVEIVNLRLTARGVIPRPRTRRVEQADDRAAPAEPAAKGHRTACFQDADGFVSTPIYDRYALPAGACVAGPAILEEFDSTVVIHPGYEGNVNAFGSVHLVLAEARRPAHTLEEPIEEMALRGQIEYRHHPRPRAIQPGGRDRDEDDADQTPGDHLVIRPGDELGYFSPGGDQGNGDAEPHRPADGASSGRGRGPLLQRRGGEV